MTAASSEVHPMLGGDLLTMGGRLKRSEIRKNHRRGSSPDGARPRQPQVSTASAASSAACRDRAQRRAEGQS
jgi:hypothetical protein